MSTHALGVALSILITRCAPNVGPRTMSAIVSVESGGNPYAIDDDDAHISYNPTSLDQAISIASKLQSIGHNFDAGIAQINSSNFASQQLTNQTVFDPCLNLHASSDILSDAYQASKRIPWLGHAARSLYEAHAQEQIALYHAFSTYNSGDPERSLGYAQSVVAAATGGFSDSMMAKYLPSENRQIEHVHDHPKAPKKAPVILTFSPALDTKRVQYTLPLASIDFARLAKTAGLTK